VIKILIIIFLSLRNLDADLIRAVAVQTTERDHQAEQTKAVFETCSKYGNGNFDTSVQISRLRIIDSG